MAGNTHRRRVHLLTNIISPRRYNKSSRCRISTTHQQKKKKNSGRNAAVVVVVARRVRGRRRCKHWPSVSNYLVSVLFSLFFVVWHYQTFTNYLKNSKYSKQPKTHPLYSNSKNHFSTTLQVQSSVCV